MKINNNVTALGRHKGASMPAILVFLAMATLIALVGIKLYPVYFEHWLLKSVIESFETDPEIKELSDGEIERRFRLRMQTNNIREISFNEAVEIEKADGVVTIYVEYESRVDVYKNIDAVITFDETTEIFL